MKPRPAWKSYLILAVVLLPTLLIWFFWLLILMPKFRALWHRGTGGSEVEHMSAPLEIMGIWSSYAIAFSPGIVLAVLGLLLILELGLKSWWPKWRFRVLAGLGVLLNAIVMITICINMVLCLMLVEVSQRGIKSLEKTIKSSN